MIKIIKSLPLLLSLISAQWIYGQTCIADAGENMAACNGEGSSNKVYLDGSGSSISDGDVNYEWNVLTEVGDGNWKRSLVITGSQSDEVDPYFKYPYELASDTTFFIELRVFDDNEVCEARDTILVFLYSDMCPFADAGSDQSLSNGCDLTASLDGTDSEDPQEDVLSFQWSSLDGYNDLFLVSDSSIAIFQFPEIETDQIFSFKLVVYDSTHEISDTVKVAYYDNDAPVANAGSDLTTCEYQFQLSADQSYDVNWNELSYTWTSLDGLSISGAATKTPTMTSPTDLTQDSTYHVALEVNDGYCSSYDTVLVTIEDNLCPIADAGENVRVPKFDPRKVELNAATNSFDPEGNELTFEWTTPTGEIILDSILTVSDQDSTSRYSKSTYHLQVMDGENAVTSDSVTVIFSQFSAPINPSIYAVASHGQILVSWDGSSEASSDSLTGYFDFEGYKLYRSIDGGVSWGGEDDKLYDYNGEFVGWSPYAQFDYSFDEDHDQCIYVQDGCESEDTRQASIHGLDPLAPRFTLGENTGIEYSFVDSNVVDGIEYTYSVTAYDIGLTPLEISYEPSETDSSVFVADTLWSTLNPGHLLGPDTIAYYDVNGNWIRNAPNQNRGYPSLESARGDSGDHNFTTVIPGYTALDISFPDENDIETLFKSDTANVGTGNREYFIVDRTKIEQDRLIYEIQATQGSAAVEGMACEDPYVFGYVVDDQGNPSATNTHYEENLNFFEKDSISGLPGTIHENGSYIVPIYDIVTEIGKWSDQFKGIRYKMENEMPLKTSAAPDVGIDTLLFSWSSDDSSSMDTSYVDSLERKIFPELSYTNIISYNRRLNFDYKIEFFSEPIGDTIEVLNAQGQGYMFFPFRITNLYTGKKVGLACNDFGSEDLNPIDFENGASDYVWNRGEDIFLRYDSIRVAGEWIEAYNYNLDLSLWIENGVQTQWWPSRDEYDDSKDYNQGNIIYYKQMLWVASIPTDAGVEPLSIHADLSDDGERNNPWRLVYPWQGGEQMNIKPQKFFVDGDNWYSDMTVLGKEIGIPDTLDLDTIKVVPNPYKARSHFNETSNERRIRFTHLPKKCQISIYTITGEHVTTFAHDAEFDSNEWWNLRTGNNQDGPEVAPGLYIYVIEFPEEKKYTINTYNYDDSYLYMPSFLLPDDKKEPEKTKYYIGKFAVIR